MKIPLRQYWTLLRKYLKPQWPRVLLLAVFILSHIGMRLLNPQVMRFFIDTAAAGGAQQTLVNAALLFFGVAIVSQALSIANAFLGEYVAWTATNDLRLDLVLHCLKLDQSFHKAHTVGELLERIDGDVNTLSNFFSRFIVYVLGNALLMGGILILLFFEDWRVGIGVLLFTALALAALIHIRTIGVPHWTKVRAINATFYGFLGELLMGTEDIRANGGRAYMMRRFDELTTNWFPIQLKANMVGSILWTSNIGIFALGNAIAFGLSAFLWQAEEITIGTVYLIFHYIELLRGPMTQLRNQIEDLQQAEASIDRIERLIATESKLKDGDGGTLPSKALSVEFNNVSFSYDEKEAVLKNVTFQLRPGRVLGLLGRTGSGKTTLARLLLRLYDPGGGEIRLGGVTPQSVQLSHLRRRVEMVTQEVQLFQATIRDNLTFFNPAITDDQIIAALDDLGLGNWLRSRSDGLDTELTSGSSNLSAGQAQLLAFARVFLADPGLVILDEASSRLDPATEKLIENAISKLLRDRTGVIIAHHLSTVNRADDILILEDGRILEHGERVQLAHDPNSRFVQLLQTGLQEVLV